MELAGTNETDHSNSMIEKEEEIVGTNEDVNIDEEILKRSRSKRNVSKNSQEDSITVM